MSKLIIIRGYPGSGKTTIGKQLEKRGLGTFIDHNAILTFLANIVGTDDGIYNEIAQLEQGMCRTLLGANKSVIVARGFSNKNSIDPYINIAKALDVKATVVRLDVSNSILFKRVQSPERKLDFNPTIDEAYAKEWMDKNPLEPYDGEFVISNEYPIGTVVDKILETL